MYLAIFEIMKTIGSTISCSVAILLRSVLFSYFSINSCSCPLRIPPGEIELTRILGPKVEASHLVNCSNPAFEIPVRRRVNQICARI